MWGCIYTVCQRSAYAQRQVSFSACRNPFSPHLRMACCSRDLWSPGNEVALPCPFLKRSVRCTTHQIGMTCATVCLLALISLTSMRLWSRPVHVEVLLQGRFAGHIDEQTGLATLPVLFSWPASSVHASFIGSSITATLSAVRPTRVHGEGGHFAFYVDQQQVALDSVNSTNPVLRWKIADLKPGQHNLTITKLTEATYGLITLDSLAVAAGGRFIAPALPKALQSGRRIMFIGDSFTIGYANIGGSECNTSGLYSENALLGWGPLTAGNFSADYQVIAQSGSGLVTYSVAQSTKPKISMKEARCINPDDVDLFRRQVTTDPSSVVSNYAEFVPQVVVIGGGGNDFHTPPPPLTTWTAEVLDFIQTINKEFGTPQIILLLYPVEVFLFGILTQSQAEVYTQYMTSVYTAAQQDQQDNVHLLQLTAAGIPLDDWCDAHLSAAADSAVAAQLVAFIKHSLPDWVNATYPPRVLRVTE